VTDCTFSGNQAVLYGGVIDDVSPGSSVVGSVFRGNTGGNGGVLFTVAYDVTNLSHDEFEGNSATGDGGAVYSFGELNIYNSKFSDNEASDTGGGLFLGLAADGTSVIDSDFTRNSATDGGAIGNEGQLGMGLNDVIISGNHATAYGGAIYNQSYFTTVTTQITRNVAGSGGGGIYDNGAASPADFETPLLMTTSVLDNTPDNCEPLGSIPGCTG
jgi:predicted outer membrane repeat protein